MAEGDIVRNVKIVASGENIDSTKASVKALTDATAALEAQNKKLSLVDVAAGIYVVKTAYDVLTPAVGSVASGLEKLAAIPASAAMALPNAVNDVWQKGIDQINRYVELSQKAGNLGTDFYQTLTIGAANAKQSADAYLVVVQNIGRALEQNLGATGGQQNGGAFNTLANQLQTNGNLQGQGGNVNRLNNAVTGPEQMDAALKVIQGALDAGQKLVAFKLTGTLLGPEAVENLKNDNDYIFKMQQSIANVQGKDIIAQTDIDRAARIKNELDQAYQYLGQRTGIFDSISAYFKGLVADIGVGIQSIWASVVTTFVDVVKAWDSMLAGLGTAFKGAWQAIKDLFPTSSVDPMDAAKASLTSQLGNPQNLKNAYTQTQKADDIGSPDASSTGAYAKVTADIQAYIVATNAATAAVNQTSGEQEKAKVAAQLLAAGLTESLSPAMQAARADALALGIAAGQAADALDKAQKMASGLSELKSALDSAKSTVANNDIEIQFHGQAGAIAQAKAELNLYNIARKTMTDEEAKAVVSQSGLGRAIKDTTDKLAALNKTPDAKDAYDRAEESLLKYVETTKAATTTVGLGSGAQEKARAIAQLTAAGLKDGLSPAAALAKAQMSGLGDAAGSAADALAKAKVASEIQFNKNAAFLSPEDLSIATQLKGIYGNDIPRALGSSEAAGIRFNDTIKALKEGGISFVTSFAEGLLHGKSIMDSLASAADALSRKLLDFGLTTLLNQGLGALAGTGSSVAGGTALTAGGTSAAAAITAACTAGGAALAAGGAAAGTAIGTGGTVAGVGIDVGTSVGGAALVTAGATTAVTLETAGAVTGTLINGPILALLAVIVAIGASLFSGNNQKNQQHAADVAAWKAQSDSFNSFIDTLNGKGPAGSLADATAKAMQQYKTFAEAAAKAGDIASVIEAQNAINKFQIDQAYAFGATFKATLQGMADGLGKNSPFLKAVDNVKTELASVQGFVADAATANRIAGVGDAGQATNAAKTYLLSLMQSAPSLSAVATSLETLNGTSATLQGALESLGVSSADAAKAINDGVVTAMKQITATFTDGLQREINSATGQDYNNSLADLVKQFQSNLADAAKLGLDPSIVNQWFKVSAQKIVNDAGLAGSAMANLVLQFPQLAGVITEASSVLAQAVTDAQTALNTANANVATAQGNLISAYNTESSALQATIDKTNSYIQSLKDLGNSLKLNPQLSTLSPQQQYAAAKALAESDAKLAAGGDVAAQGRLQNDLTTFLGQSKSFNASTEAYYADFQEVQGILTQAEANGQVTVSVAQQQLNVLTSQVSLLVQINSSVLTVAQAISALNVATGTASVAQKTLDTATTAAKPPASGGTLGTVAALYQAIDGRAPDAAGAAYWQSKIDAGLTGSALVSAFTAASIASSNHETVNPAIRAAYGYADGGLVTNGTYNQDSVYAKLAGNEHVTRASSVNAATFSTLSYINQNGRVPGNDGQDMRELGRIIATGNQQVLEALDNINKTYAVGSHKIAEETRKAGKQPVIRQTGNG